MNFRSETSSGRLRPPRCRESGGLRKAATNPAKRRLVLPHFAGTSPYALSSAHTKKVRSRFNAGSLLEPADQFAALYFAEDPIVAQFEVGAVLGRVHK
jgi:hypothetical protein